MATILPIKIPTDLGHGGSGLHAGSGEPTLATITVELMKLLRDLLDGPALYAQGWVICIPKADLVDGDKFTLPTGVTFTFDVSGAHVPVGGYTATNIRVDISGATTAASVAAILAPLITASAPAATIASLISGEAIVRLMSRTAGKAGNGKIVEVVADTDFLVSGMSGGRDEDAFSAVFELPASLG